MKLYNTTSFLYIAAVNKEPFLTLAHRVDCTLIYWTMLFYNYNNTYKYFMKQLYEKQLQLAITK